MTPKLPSSSPPPPPSAASAPEAVTAALLSLLNAFTHRHKNQHRASHWWSSVSLLRRCLRRLARRLAHRLGNPEPDARHMKQRVLPRAYVVVTQLAADNQHAPLGIALLAVLARLNSLLCALLPPPQDASPPHESPGPHVARSAPPSPDRGVAVSRAVIASRDPIEQHNARADRPSCDEAHLGRHQKAQPRRKKAKKSKSKTEDEFSSLFRSLT